MISSDKSSYLKCKEYRKLISKVIIQSRNSPNTIITSFHPKISNLTITSKVRRNLHIVDHNFHIDGKVFRSIAEVRKYFDTTKTKTKDVDKDIDKDVDKDIDKDVDKDKLHKMRENIKRNELKSGILCIKTKNLSRYVCFREEFLDCGAVINNLEKNIKIFMIYHYRKFQKTPFAKKNSIFEKLKHNNIYHDKNDKTIYVRFMKEQNKTYGKILDILNYNKIYEVTMISDEYIAKSKKNTLSIVDKKIIFGRITKNIICISKDRIHLIPSYFTIF